MKDYKKVRKSIENLLDNGTAKKAHIYSLLDDIDFLLRQQAVTNASLLRRTAGCRKMRKERDQLREEIVACWEDRWTTKELRMELTKRGWTKILRRKFKVSK